MQGCGVPASILGVTQCSNWHRAAELHAAFAAWTSQFIMEMLVCAFCGRVAFGNTPYARDRFKTVPCTPQAWPPYAAAHMKMALYCGNRWAITSYGCIPQLLCFLPLWSVLSLCRDADGWQNWSCCHSCINEAERTKRLAHVVTFPAKYVNWIFRLRDWTLLQVMSCNDLLSLIVTSSAMKLQLMPRECRGCLCLMWELRCQRHSSTWQKARWVVVSYEIILCCIRIESALLYKPLRVCRL